MMIYLLVFVQMVLIEMKLDSVVKVVGHIMIHTIVIVTIHLTNLMKDTVTLVKYLFLQDVYNVV
jgi:hypothetical protein